MAAGKAFQLEEDVTSVEDKIKRTDDGTSASAMNQLQDNIVKIAVEVDKSEKQVRNCMTSLHNLLACNYVVFCTVYM